MASVFKRIFNKAQIYLQTSWMDANRPVEWDNATTTLDNAHLPDRHIMPFQMQRIKQDAKSWRLAIDEAEQAWWMHRVKMQQLFIDTALNGHVLACMNKAKNDVLLKKFVLKSGDTVNEEATKLLNAKWFNDIMSYILDARFYGYSLIGLGNLVDNEFVDYKNVRRWNISPDRLNLTTLVYSLNGLNFTDPSIVDDNGNSYYDWSIWVSTPNSNAPSKCGYGLLYEVAIYEIYLRNLLGFNADYIEVFAQPFRHLRTNAKGEERDAQEDAIKNAGSTAYMVTDKDAELDIKHPTAGGRGFESYENFEKRLENKITKIILGHADAMDSTPGKLGGESGDDNPVKKALDATETINCRFVEHVINSQMIPKLINIGFPIPNGLVFSFKNDNEINEIKTAENKTFTEVSTFVKNFADAGFKVSPEWIKERTGIDVKESIVEVPEFDKKVKETNEKIKNFYAKANT